ncbi:hypothetical protein [Bradyrhizobium sp. SZCCHNRI3052]|uniref:hypothetical protein n=1 Tax=Bradyrhizobium sp. SZCCHNRI3052 TaxID=3057295 RepID=UPI0029160BA3|nr:hypothetical protein [Bradyrhizobium sp. SZCCHNRI3052]
MAWTPPEKFIRHVGITRVRQKLKDPGNALILPKTVNFGWEQFVMSVSRTRSMQVQVDGLSFEKRQVLITEYGTLTADAINVFVDEATQEFSFTVALDILADDERPSYAGKIGAAVADLVMESLGFHWRANAAELKLIPANANPANKKKEKTPDYVYDPGTKHGFKKESIVILEAKGSLSPVQAKEAPVKRRAHEAYKRQVKDFIGTTAQGLTIVNGFAVAFGAIPGNKTSRISIASPQKVTVGTKKTAQFASLSAAATGPMFTQLLHAEPQKRHEEGHEHQLDRVHIEQVQQRRDGRGGDGDGGERGGEGERGEPSGRIAFANYENVFLMCGARNASAFLRRILSGGEEGGTEPHERYQHFWAVGSSGDILVADDWLWWPPFRFGIYEPSARRVLRAAANNRFGPPHTVELPIAPARAGAPGEEFVMQGDGLALARDWPPHGPRRTWDLENGDWV